MLLADNLDEALDSGREDLYQALLVFDAIRISKMNPFTVFTLSGPVVGGLGFALGWLWLFWIGVALTFVNLFLNIASGVMKGPILPIVFIVVGAAVYESVIVGAGLGLLAWTLVEGLAELLPTGNAR